MRDLIRKIQNLRKESDLKVEDRIYISIISDKEICEKIILDIENTKMKSMIYALKASIIDAQNQKEEESALQIIISHAMFTPINMEKEAGIKKKREFTVNVLENDLFPHCKTKTQKIYFLGYMVNKLLQTSFGWRKSDDRDSYLNKRLDTTGILLNNLLRN